jgi:hypothetical protein
MVCLWTLNNSMDWNCIYVPNTHTLFLCVHISLPGSQPVAIYMKRLQLARLHCSTSSSSNFQSWDLCNKADTVTSPLVLLKLKQNLCRMPYSILKIHEVVCSDHKGNTSAWREKCYMYFAYHWPLPVHCSRKKSLMQWRCENTVIITITVVSSNT